MMRLMAVTGVNTLSNLEGGFSNVATPYEDKDFDPIYTEYFMQRLF